MEPQEVCGKTMQGANLGFFHLPKGSPRSFADLVSREMVSGSERGDQVIRLLGQTKELRVKPLLHFSRGFVGKGEGHDFRDSQGIWFSEEEV